VNPVVAATAFALLAFAANSVLCRMALRDAHIDAASFVSIRLIAGALTLWLLIRIGRRGQRLGGDWRSALALLAYAIAFTFAYVGLTAGTGALLLFGAVAGGDDRRRVRRRRAHRPYRYPGLGCSPWPD